MILFKKDIILEEQEQPKQSEGRKAVQWYNSTIHEVAVTDSTWPGKAASKDRQWKYFLLRFREGTSLLRRHSVMGQAQEGHSVCFEASALLVWAPNTDVSPGKCGILGDAASWHVDSHGGWGCCHQSSAQSWTEDFYKFRLVEQFMTSVAQLVTVSTETRPTW